MKKILEVVILICLLLTSCSSIKHQLGLNIDSIQIEYSERNQPERPQDPPFFYYDLQFKIPYQYNGLIDTEFLKPEFSIAGQRYTDKPRINDIIITVTYGLLNISDVDVREEEIEVKDEKTQEKYKTRIFWLECNYGMDVKVAVSKGNNMIETYFISQTSFPNIFQSKEFYKRKDALIYWELNENYLKEDFVKTIAYNTINTLSYELSRRYGYPIYQYTETVISIDDKNIKENQVFKYQCSDLSYKLSNIDGYTPLNKSDVNDLINYFKSIPEKYPDPINKSEIRIRYAAYSNLSLIYFLLEQPQESIKWANMLIENGYQTGRGNNLKKKAYDLEQYLSTHPIKTTHFMTDSYFKLP